MGRSPCCVRDLGLNRGAWTVLEDQILVDYINAHGEGKWRRIPKEAGLKRCGKGCRLRWLNYLRPDIKRGNITQEEEDLIIRLYKLLGNRWSLIAGRIPGRTDNEIKNYWNTKLGKKVFTHEHQVGQQPLLQFYAAESNEDKIIINKTKPSTTAMKVVESIAAVRTKAVRCNKAAFTTSSLQYLVETGDKFITTSEAVDKSSATSFISTTTATSEDHFDVGRVFNVSAKIQGNSDDDDYYWELCRFGEYDSGGAGPNSHKWQSAGGDNSTMFSEEMLRDWMTEDCFHRQI